MKRRTFAKNNNNLMRVYSRNRQMSGKWI